MKRPAHITLVNGVETSAIDIADRGLAYGDGLFETMRVVEGDVPLLSLHIERFLKGVEVLGLGDKLRMQRDFENYLQIALKEIKLNACLETSVIKMMITRGRGGRGYVPPDDAQCNFIAQVFDMPIYPEDYSIDGVVVRECQYRLGFQPQLAGIKHLNRLDQVLASQELINEPEGIILDYENKLIEGTKSNVLVFKKNEILTPSLDLVGVQGVLRACLMSEISEFKVSEVDIPFSELLTCDGIALINSVFGIWFVKTLLCQDGQKINFKPSSTYASIRRYLAQTYKY